MEKILVDILRIRNKTLFAKGLPLSDAAFIKSRAEDLYADLYVPEDESNRDFKCSVGWISRFKERHKHDIEPFMNRTLCDNSLDGKSDGATEGNAYGTGQHCPTSAAPLEKETVTTT